MKGFCQRFTVLALVAAVLSVSPLMAAVTGKEKVETEFPPDYHRIVILSPAAADIFEKLGAESLVVGVTKSVEGFPKAKRVGSHIRPNLEIIASLKPDLIVLSSNRFFSKEMAKRVGGDIFYYNPATCQEILEKILQIGAMVGRNMRARQLATKLSFKLTKLKPLSHPPTVLYEVMSNPYMVAGKKSIVANMVELAGGRYLVNAPRKLVRFSYEKAVSLKPQVYLYQVGPMNKNPVPPQKRPYFKGLRSKFVKVDELSFARPNTKTFDNVLWLNSLFYKMEKR